MTANTISESVEDSLANGVDSFVSEPVTLQTEGVTGAVFTILNVVYFTPICTC